MVVRPMCLTFSIPGICVDGWWWDVERQIQGSDGARRAPSVGDDRRRGIGVNRRVGKISSPRFYLVRE